MLIDERRCSGCGRCVAACPARLFTLEVSGFRKHAVLHDAGRCDGCLKCLEECPVGALKERGEKVGDPSPPCPSP